MYYNLNKYPNSNIEHIIKRNCIFLKEHLLNHSNQWSAGVFPICRVTTKDLSDSLFRLQPSNDYGSKVVCSSNREIYDYLKKQNLKDYLGIHNDYFDCIMHNDSDKKASIYETDNEDWLYKCFSDECNFKIGDINKITEYLTGLNRPDTLEFLMEVYNITLIKTDWQIRQEKIINSNIELLLDIENLETNYPVLYKRIYSYIPQLIILHEFAKNSLSLEDVMNSKYVTFSAPIRKLSEALIIQEKSGRLETIRKRNNILTFIGLLLKLSDTDIEEEQLKELKEFAWNNKYTNYQNLYALPSYNYEVLNNAENKSKEFVQSGMTVKGFGREMLIKGLDKEEVEKVYPRQKNIPINGLDEKIMELIKEEIYKYIDNYGYCLEKKIYTNGYFIKRIKNKIKIHDRNIINKSNVERIYKVIIPELINKEHFIRCRLTKELKEVFNIKENGNPNIIYKQEEFDKRKNITT